MVCVSVFARICVYMCVHICRDCGSGGGCSVSVCVRACVCM